MTVKKNEARQGIIVKNMPTILVTSTVLAIAGMLIAIGAF